MGRGFRAIQAAAPAGLLVSAALLTFAAAGYPGGYDWLQQSISSLFQPVAANGEPNSARLPAATAVVAFCASMALVFQAIANRCPTRRLAKIVQISGVGSMVYAAFAVTPMHDLMVNVALVFYLVAVVAIGFRLWTERRFGMVVAGCGCLAVKLASATVYYGQLLEDWLPLLQKLSLVLWTAWLLWLFRGDVASTKTAPESRA